MTAAERLVEAEDALHRLLTGSAVVELTDQNGEHIRYVPASIPQLRTYITALRREIGGTQVGPMHFWGRP